MKFTKTFLAVALLTGVIAAPLAAPKGDGEDTVGVADSHVHDDYAYRQLYKREDDAAEERGAKANYVYRAVYKREDDAAEERDAKANYVYRAVYKREDDAAEERDAKANYVYRAVYKRDAGLVKADMV